MNRHPRLLLAGAIALSAAATAAAQDRAPVVRRGADPAPAHAAAKAIDPEKAYLDFATGQFREVTNEDLDRLDRMRAESAEAEPAAVGIVEHGHGMRSARVPDAYHLALAVRQRADGTLEIVCAPNRSVTRRLGTTPRPRAEER